MGPRRLAVFCLSADGMRQTFFQGGLLLGGGSAVQLLHSLSS
ncbi:hypothetical protein AABB02_22105 [Streptomyces rimosus]